MIDSNKNRNDESMELQPWAHEEENFNFLFQRNSHRLDDTNKFSPRNSRKKYKGQWRSSFSQEPSKSYQCTMRSLSEKKSGLMNSNKVSLPSYQYPSTIDCAQILKINGKSEPKTSNIIAIDNYLYKKPIVSTTYVCFFNEPGNQQDSSRFKKDKKRPKTCSPAKSTPSSKVKREELPRNSSIIKKKRKQNFCLNEEEKCLNMNQVKREKGVNAQHFQKLLKLKQKFRRKAKNNSNCKGSMKQKEIEYHEELTSETVQYFNKLYQPMQENRKIRSQKRSQELLKPKNASEDDIQIKESPIYLGFLRKK